VFSSTLDDDGITPASWLRISLYVRCGTFKKHWGLIKIFQKSLKKEIAELSNDILNSVWSNRIEQSNIESLGIKKKFNTNPSNSYWKHANQNLSIVVSA